MDPIHRTIQLAEQNVEQGGRPFACVIMKGDKLLAESANQAAQTQDPTAHAEILAIREACQKEQTEHLTDCTIYILASPCPMCLGAIYYCSPKNVVYVVAREEYEPFYRDDRKYFELDNFYEEYCKPMEQRRLPIQKHFLQEGVNVYKQWNAKHGTKYAT